MYHMAHQSPAPLGGSWVVQERNSDSRKQERNFSRNASTSHLWPSSTLLSLTFSVTQESMATVVALCHIIFHDLLKPGTRLFTCLVRGIDTWQAEPGRGAESDLKYQAFSPAAIRACKHPHSAAQTTGTAAGNSHPHTTDTPPALSS